MDQGWVHSPNVTPSGYPTEFWGLFGMLAPSMHTTQQTCDCLFAKSDTGHWSRHNL